MSLQGSTVGPIRHYPEYVMEGALLGLFMASACVVGCLANHPASPLRVWIPHPTLLRFMTGLAMGATAVVLIHSPWGKQSGAHFNPAVTLMFWRLGKMRGVDALGYVGAQFIGGLLGVISARLALGPALEDATVNWVVTTPGAAGIVPAMLGEFAIATAHSWAVLTISNHPKHAPYTGWLAGLLVACWITLESPLSGMSMNPARTVASALPAGIWTGWWIYFTAPVAGMLLGAILFVRRQPHSRPACPKLLHAAERRCIFCGHLMDNSVGGAPDNSGAWVAPHREGITS